MATTAVSDPDKNPDARKHKARTPRSPSWMGVIVLWRWPSRSDGLASAHRGAQLLRRERLEHPGVRPGALGEELVG